MRHQSGLIVTVAGMLLSSTALTAQELDRTVLPIPQQIPDVITEPDWRLAEMPPRWDVTAPENAPNVVIVLIDDMGFGVPDSFGGPVAMPTFDLVADEGVRLNRFHTTAVCSATRAALLSGHNSHAVNLGAIAEHATGFPGNTSVRPDTVTPLAEILRLNGYNTAMFGKNHETPSWEKTSSGPFDHWPTGSGFETFYGFMTGETNQWAPALFNGTTPVTLSPDPAYHFSVDMTDHAIQWVNAQHSLTPDTPFFLYFAPGATHAPHHVPEEWADMYAGQFDMGWDALREQTFARQKELGVIPADAILSPRPDEIPAWDSFTEEEQQLFARQMEVYAGYASHIDHEVGRLVERLEDLGELDNTVFIYIAGDNGASAEGGPVGTWNEMAALNSVDQTTDDMLRYLDRWGGPETYPHYAMGWAWAGNTPFQWVKQIAGHLGGNRSGAAIMWPDGFEARGEIRSQFVHVNDVAPTVLEAAGIPYPSSVNGIEQRPMDGVSFLYALDDPDAPERHTTQYFEVFGNRGIYHDGWLASTLHNVPWLQNQVLPSFDEDVWELYDLRTDFSQAVDLAGSEPEMLAELLAVFDSEAIRNRVYPIDDRKAERIVGEVGRPNILNGRTEMTFYEGMSAMPEVSIISVKNVPFTVTTEIEVDEAANGVIFAQGGRFGGWSLYMVGGHVAYEHNFHGIERYKVRSDSPIPVGRHVVELAFVPADPTQLGSGGAVTLRVDGDVVGEMTTPRMVYGAFAFDEGADVGFDDGTAVSEDYPQMDNAFTGQIAYVTIAQRS